MTIKWIEKYKTIILVSILLIAGVLRIWNLSHVPPSASLDEASIGYNAYSVLKTGTDEFNTFPLISQRGYDDFRRSTYLLMVVPSIAVFDLSVFAVRFPSVVLSILTVWAVYLIALQLFKKRSVTSFWFAFLSALLLAISPWHIYISRLGHESNACLSFLVFGILFFLKGRTQARNLIFSALFLTLSMVSYYSGQVFVPLFVFGLFIIYGKTILKQLTANKKSITFSLLTVLIMVPVMWSIFSPEALIRYRGTSTLSPEAHSELFAKRVELRNKAVQNKDLIGSIIYNRRLFFVQVLYEGYISHLQPSFLFLNSGKDSFKAPNMGLLYIWQFPIVIIGIISFLMSNLIGKRAKLLLILWFLLGPLPASIATQAPHAMRAYNFLPTWQLFTSFGLVYLLFKLGKFKLIGLGVLFIVLAFSLSIFWNNYFIVFPKEQSKSFQYALTQSIPYIKQHEKEYSKIVISNEDNLYQSYMFLLYHSKYNPELYHKQGGTISGGYKEPHKFGKYEFRPIAWENEKKGNILYVGNPKDIPIGMNVLYEGKYLDGTTGIHIGLK